jgi:hypothetical protein
MGQWMGDGLPPLSDAAWGLVGGGLLSGYRDDGLIDVISQALPDGTWTHPPLVACLNEIPTLAFKSRLSPSPSLAALFSIF